jgi:hypothetical protein
VILALGVKAMAETSLDEIFSGDVPRIDTVSVFPGYASKVGTYTLRHGGVYIVEDGFIVLNKSYERFKNQIKETGTSDRAVFLEKSSYGYRIKYGALPHLFYETFSLPYKVTFKYEELPITDLISKQVAEIQEFQVNLDSGIVGIWKWVNVGKLWDKVRGLNEMLVQFVES